MGDLYREIFTRFDSKAYPLAVLLEKHVGNDQEQEDFKAQAKLVFEGGGDGKHVWWFIPLRYSKAYFIAMSASAWSARKSLLTP